jgi:fatty acyl-CoA reductase
MEFPNNPMHNLLSVEESIEIMLRKDEPLTNLPTIPQFYAEREIFITGGTGFMGKVLIEKLLRSCADIKKIYLLMRPLKEKTIEERLKMILELPLFDVLHKINPKLLDKLIPIAGDVTELDLGMSSNDIKRMKNVSIVFHTAASVRFDDPLKKAVMMNTRGTREVMKFAEGLDDIKVVMHVSTTYSNPHRHVIEEHVYPPTADWRKTIEICEKIDDSEIDVLTSHYSSFMPNTYTFTKNLAESIANDYKDKIPLVIFRPSIVVSAVNEPLPGWVKLKLEIII